MSPRPYRGVQRRPAAEDTRARIIAAGRSLLTAESGSEFSLDSVARNAGVARMTVYYQFGSRRGLLEAMFDALGGRYFQNELPRVMSQPEPLNALAGLIDVFCHFWASERLGVRRIRGMGALDPDFEESLRGRDERRRLLLRTVLLRIAETHGRPSEEAFDETVDVLYAFTKFETFDSLANDIRSAEDVSLLIQRLARLVLGVPGTPSDGR